MEIIEFLSLRRLDPIWRSALEQSKLASTARKAFSSFTDKIQEWPQSKRIGHLLQTMSFYLSALLYACLPLPQFCKDKEGLAGIVLVSFFLWLGGVILADCPKRKTNAIDALIIVFFAINIISAFSSHYFSQSIHGLLKLLVYVIAYFLLSIQLIHNPKRQITILGILLLSSTLVSLYGLYQYKIGVEPLATWEDPTLENQVTRIYATFNNPNLLAGYLLPLAMLGASISFISLYKRKIFWGLIITAATCLMFVAIALTGSRGAYIGTFAGLIGFFFIIARVIWQHNKFSNKWLVLSGILVVLLLIAIALHRLPGFEQRLLSIFAGRQHSSNSFRLNVWHSCFSMFKDNWLTGIGVGNQTFRLAYGLYMRSGFDALAAYSVPLEIMVEAGIFSLVCFLLIILSCLCRAHILCWDKNNFIFQPTNKIESDNAKMNIWLDNESFNQAITIGTALALLALLAHGLVDTVFFRPQVQFIFYLSLVLLSNLSSSEKSSI